MKAVIYKRISADKEPKVWLVVEDTSCISSDNTKCWKFFKSKIDNEIQCVVSLPEDGFFFLKWLKNDEEV